MIVTVYLLRKINTNTEMMQKIKQYIKSTADRYSIYGIKQSTAYESSDNNNTVIKVQVHWALLKNIFAHLNKVNVQKGFERNV